MRAWHACDIAALAALLRDDAVLTMPPQAIRIVGRAAVAEFFATVPADGRLDLIRCCPPVPTATPPWPLICPMTAAPAVATA
ncbi:MAG TPA: nuclear transport factor 2 family protein [Actinomycetes bacterium]|nr:nuclear transport factor 2 family protein [Actinomycetes bacterium]